VPTSIHLLHTEANYGCHPGHISSTLTIIFGASPRLFSWTLTPFFCLPGHFSRTRKNFCVPSSTPNQHTDAIFWLPPWTLLEETECLFGCHPRNLGCTPTPSFGCHHGHLLDIASIFMCYPRHFASTLTQYLPSTLDSSRGELVAIWVPPSTHLIHADAIFCCHSGHFSSSLSIFFGCHLRFLSRTLTLFLVDNVDISPAHRRNFLHATLDISRLQ
jgi:hypothetical protein